MPENSSKLWLQSSLNKAAVRRVRDVIQSLGKSLPCRVTAVSGAIVKVAFEVNASPWTLPESTIPKAESNWVRMPTQVGDFGWTVPADVYLGGVSGLGGGTANLAKPGNLAALVFVPISNSSSPPDDQNAAQVMGPNGAIIRTLNGTSSVITNQSGTTITFGSVSLTVNAAGVTITVNGTAYTFGPADATFNGTTFMTHVHSGVTTGSGDTGGVV